MTERSHTQHKAKRLAVIALFAVAALSLIPISRTNAWQMATSRQPERLTELYFAEPEHLPSTVEPGQTITPRFTLHNLEGHDTTYNYELRLSNDEPDTTPVITTGTTAVAAGGSSTVSQPIIIPTFSHRAKLTISIQPTNQQIHYWVERAAHGETN